MHLSKEGSDAYAVMKDRRGLDVEVQMRLAGVPAVAAPAYVLPAFHAVTHFDPKRVGLNVRKHAKSIRRMPDDDTVSSGTVRVHSAWHIVGYSVNNGDNLPCCWRHNLPAVCIVLLVPSPLAAMRSATRIVNENVHSSTLVAHNHVRIQLLCPAAPINEPFTMKR